jgi:hypothetical protein
MSEAAAFEATARGELAKQEAGSNDVEPVTFYTADGTSYTSTDPVEITRLRASRAHFATKQAAADPVSADDTRFHPEAHSVEEVLAYTQESPQDAERVLAEEQAGKARKGIIGDKE